MPCQYIEAEQLLGLDGQSLAQILSRPVVVRGLIDHWPVFDRWANVSAFASRFGKHGVVARRFNFARRMVREAGADPATTTIPLSDLEGREANEHVVIYQGEQGI